VGGWPPQRLPTSRVRVPYAGRQPLTGGRLRRGAGATGKELWPIGLPDGWAEGRTAVQTDRLNHGRDTAALWRRKSKLFSSDNPESFRALGARCRCRFRLMPLQRSHHPDPGEHRWPVMFCNE